MSFGIDDLHLEVKPMGAAGELFKSKDLPERLGPMTVKELRQGLRRGMFVYPFLGIHLLAVVAMAVVGDILSFLLDNLLLLLAALFCFVVTGCTCREGG